MKKRFRYWVFLVLAAYLVLEVSASTLHWLGILDPRQVWIIEDTGKGGLRFDPISGFRHPPHPMRHAKITRGQIEFIGAYQGNNLGFPDRGDFWPERPADDVYRVAVFGDSFSAGSFLMQNWVDTAELLAAESGQRIELMNFSLDGAGLANWWSIATRLLDAENYELDALLFAVYWGNLDRAFIIADHSEGNRHRSGYVPYDDLEGWPRTVEEAQPYLESLPIRILPTAAFYETLQGRRRGVPLPYVLMRLLALLDPDPAMAATEEPSEVYFSPAQHRFMDDLAQFAQRRELRVLVISVPDWMNVVDEEEPLPKVRAFAERLGVEAVNGTGAFDGLAEADLRAMWLPHDGHWDQPASDRYAAFALDQILALRGESTP